MSDSDDTDILLLIPPNYYLVNAEEKLIEEDLQKLQRRQFSSLQELDALEYRYKSTRRDLSKSFRAMDLAGCKNDAITMPPPPSTTAAYQYLPPSRKTELNHINAKLHHLERDDNPSDISSISAHTVRTQFGPSKQNRETVGMVHSTPKCMSSSFKEPAFANKERMDVSAHKDEGVLFEIDNFLSNERDPNANVHNWQQRQNDYFLNAPSHKLNPQLDVQPTYRVQTTSLPTSMNTLHGEKAQIPTSYQMSKADNNLISLSEIWGKSGQETAIATSSQSNLKEEQLRRQHLEKTVRQLQSRLLEYQQRLSVAIEVDRAKDNALNTAQSENKSLSQDLQNSRQILQEYEQQRKHYEEKSEALQKELAQAVSLATRFQDKNEKLETELSNCSRKTSESCHEYKQKLEQLEIKAHACKRSEELAINELHKLKDKYAKSEHLYEKTKLTCDELEKENSTLKHQKEMLQEYHQKQKNKADNLESQKKSMQETLAHLTENESALKKKLELQQKTLKSHYQQQLEHVVAQKLKEFQEQLDKTEETLRSEARERERLIAERAVKQLELINEKNELELNLLQEKHNEEVELYRIQLANASKKIDDLDIKLSLYKSKRADIAEKLHSVMETQWQKALEILTSPNLTRLTQNEMTDNESPDTNDTNTKATTVAYSQQQHPHHYETPKSSKKENNLNVQKHESPPMDRLQAYIELLLSKSPSDFDKLDEILSLTSKAKQAKEKLEKAAKRQCYSKPPWKS